MVIPDNKPDHVNVAQPHGYYHQNTVENKPKYDHPNMITDEFKNNIGENSLPLAHFAKRGRSINQGAQQSHHVANRFKRRRPEDKKKHQKFLENKRFGSRDMPRHGIALPYTGTHVFHQSVKHDTPPQHPNKSPFFVRKKFSPFAVRYQSANMDYLETVYGAVLTHV